MMRFSRVIVPAVAALLLASPVSAQLLGGGGPVGGVVGGVMGTAGNTMGQVGNTVGGVVGGPGAGPLGGVTGPFSNGLNGLGFNGIPPSLDSVSGPPGLSFASPMEIENYREARLRALIEANRSVLDRD